MQERLAKVLVATGTPVVVVLVNGGPVASVYVAEHAAAVIEAW
jgi:beta-glucosidase